LGLVDRPADELERELERIETAVRASWTARAVPAAAESLVTRSLRVAALRHEELRAHPDFSLERVIARLVQRDEGPTSVGASAPLPFPIAVTPAIVRTRSTVIGQAHALSWGIELSLRFLVAVDLSVLLAEDDPKIVARLARLLEPYTRSRLDLEAWEALAFV